MDRAHTHSGLPILLGLLALSLGILIGSIWMSSNSQLDESEAVRVAKEFLLSCPTFRFDGIQDSIKVDSVSRAQSGWNVKINFNCAHSGYGNRSGQLLLMVITPHRISITIEKGQVSTAIVDDVWDEISQSHIHTEENAIKAARDFLLSCATFKFDGMSESVKVVKILPWGGSFTWLVELSFMCRHSGYGDRTGLVLLQVITSHQISVVVEKGVVTRAVIDDVWDEINQRWVPSLSVTTDKPMYLEGGNMTITIRNVSNQTVRFDSTAYGISFEKLEKDSWVFHSSIYGAELIVSLEPGRTKQIAVILSSKDHPFTSGEYRVLSCGWMEQDGQHIQVCGRASFTAG